jgi:hypothetical protein
MGTQAREKPRNAGMSQCLVDFDIPCQDALDETANIRRRDFDTLDTAEIDGMDKMLDLAPLGAIDRTHEHAAGPEVEEWRIGKIRDERLRNLYPESLQLALFQIADTDRHSTTL